MKIFKMRNLITILIVTVIVTFISCENSDDLNPNNIEGTYIGTLLTDISSKSSVTKTENSATAVVRKIGDKIEVHCYDGNFDITVLLDTYIDNDNIMVCLTGNDFDLMYGHMLGQGHMNGNMQNTGTEWMQHLNQEHQASDEHFGGFDMQHHSFSYTFMLDDMEYHFQGIKN